MMMKKERMEILGRFQHSKLEESVNFDNFYFILRRKHAWMERIILPGTVDLVR